MFLDGNSLTQHRDGLSLEASINFLLNGLKMVISGETEKHPEWSEDFVGIFTQMLSDIEVVSINVNKKLTAFQKTKLKKSNAA